MRTIFKLFAIAAALGLAPAAASAQSSASAQPAPQAAPTRAGPSDAISARSQAQPAAPSQANQGLPESAQQAPSNSQVAGATAASQATAEPGIGQPDGRAGLQNQYTPIGEEAAWFHNVILMPSITVITLIVVALLGVVIIRFRRGANPEPSRTTHNTLLEVVWTLVPVLILVVIAVPSIRLLAHQYSPPRADLTIKAIGNQWFWEYEYPDHGVQLVANMLPDNEADARHEPRQLAVDERMVVPAGAVVKMIITSNDVVHAWGVPGFWTKIDAVPGRLNETWFRVDRPGLYYGACYELCGARHGYMPIAVEVVSPQQFAAWVAAHHGHMPAARGAAAPAPAPQSASPSAAPGQGVTAGNATAAAPGSNVSAGTASPPVTNQGQQ